MYKVYYGQGKDLSKSGDVKEITCNSFEELVKLFQCIEETHNDDVVYLFTEGMENYEEDDIFLDTREIIVTANMETLIDYLAAFDVLGSELHIQEYESFEIAYSVALNMREGGMLAYDKN